MMCVCAMVRKKQLYRKMLEFTNCAKAEEGGSATTETVLLPRLILFLFKL
jgi:hypothetical protein